MASSSYNSCTSALPPYVCSPCGTPESGRIRSVVFLEKGTVLADVSDPNEWALLINAGKAFAITDVNGTYDSENTTAPGYGNQSERTTGQNHTLEFQTPYSCENRDFFNAARKTSQYTIYYITELSVNWSGVAVNIAAKAPVTASLSDTREYMVTVTWSAQDIPECADKPESIFDSCTLLQEFLLANLIIL